MIEAIKKYLLQFRNLANISTDDYPVTTTLRGKTIDDLIYVKKVHKSYFNSEHYELVVDVDELYGGFEDGVRLSLIKSTIGEKLKEVKRRADYGRDFFSEQTLPDSLVCLGHYRKHKIYRYNNMKGECFYKNQKHALAVSTLQEAKEAVDYLFELKKLNNNKIY